VKVFKKVLAYLSFIGINPEVIVINLKNFPWFIRDYKKLKRQLKGDPQFPFGKLNPILTDKTLESGTSKGHYFSQDLLIAQRVFYNKPEKHIDIGSRVDGFIAHTASFRQIEMFDIRPLAQSIKNVKFIQADLMELSQSLTDYSDSISSLHAIEHFGLGRYNDPIDAYGHVKALKNIEKILKTGGRFYFSTPIGPQRIEFNAQRVFSLEYLLTLFNSHYKLERFSYVDDSGTLHENIELTNVTIKNNCGCNYGCGIFELIKL
jgi:SAM-dependent methyltransferase